MTIDSSQEETAWTPDLFGPIFKRDSITLREALSIHHNDNCTRNMAAFVPDELISQCDLTSKSFRKFNAVVGLVNTSRFFALHNKYINAENGGSYALIDALNRYIKIMIEEVYSTFGDVLKLSSDGLFAIWKTREQEFMSQTVHNVILCGQRIQAAISSLEAEEEAPKVDMVVAAGELLFSIIGDQKARHFVASGTPIDDLKYAKRISLPGDLVLSSSAWEHCSPSQYEYVIKDTNNIKILKVLGDPIKSLVPIKVEPTIYPDTNIPQDIIDKVLIENFSNISIASIFSEDEDASAPKIVAVARLSVVEAIRQKLGNELRSYLITPALNQIDISGPLEYLTEIRQLTIVIIDIIPSRCSIHELISLVDQLFTLFQGIVERYGGSITTLNLYDKGILFCIAYGLKGCVGETGDNTSTAKNGMMSVLEIMRVADITGIKGISIGVSTGLTFCGVIGHAARRQYVIIGATVDKAMGMMEISYDKVSCDYDTVLHSRMGRKYFRSRGLKSIRTIGECQVYHFAEDTMKTGGFNVSSKLDYCYPLLGRFQELEYFKDILDEIGVSGRSYSGLLIEGEERSGKSRILDAFATIVRNRQLKLLQLPLHASHVEKSFSVLHHLFLQLFDAENCKTIDDRERALSNKLAGVLTSDDFCYLNTIMRVRFPLSNDYCMESDWKRHSKALRLFDIILTKVSGKVCILLDDVQYLDYMSWQFLSFALKNVNVVLVMTLLEPHSWDDLSQTEADICKQKALLKRFVSGLEPKLLSAFACQFLNVLAIPKPLEKSLEKNSGNSIRWCETYLMSVLQNESLNFVTMLPHEAVLYDLVFPDNSLLTKIPSYLTPEEVAPPLHWTQMSSLNVCIISSHGLNTVDEKRDVDGLRIAIYDRMKPYEQDLIKCGAALGGIFMRNMLETLVTNSTPLYTAKGKYKLKSYSNPSMAEMIRIRILECSMIQRKSFYTEHTSYFTFKKRSTFSNMHHLVACDCRPSRIFAGRSLPIYAHCKILSFTITSYRKFFYDILSTEETEDYHTKAVLMLEKETHKCTTCGGGRFLRVVTPECKSKNNKSDASNEGKIQEKPIIRSRVDKRNIRRQSVFSDSSDLDRSRTSIRRMSIMPVFHDLEEGETPRVSQDSGLPKNEYITALSERLGTKPPSEVLRTIVDHSYREKLKDFSHIDYRNCQCIDVLGYLYWKLYHHIKSSGDLDKMVNFMIEYAAGLIQTAQPSFAVKFLTNITATTDMKRRKDRSPTAAEDTKKTKGVTLVLLGDAYMELGYFPQAKKAYIEALTLRGTDPIKSTRAVCYATIIENLRHKILGFPDYAVNRITGESALTRLKMASSLQRLSMVLVTEGNPKFVKLTILQSLRAAFESAGGFIEKGETYLSAVKIFRELGNMELLRPLEDPMLEIIQMKVTWNSAEKLAMLANVFYTMYEIRALRGEFEEAIEIGHEVLMICNHLKLTRIKLSLLPSMIEILVWTKHINESFDLMRELYFSSDEDVDQSAITWYYALSLEFLLDAGMILESYDTCYDHFRKMIVHKSRACVLRDPDSLYRLMTCICIWQLRMATAVGEDFMKTLHIYPSTVTSNRFSQIFSCCKVLECYLLILLHRVNIKKSSDLIDRVKDAETNIKFLEQASGDAMFVKPFLHLLSAYMEILRGRKSASQITLQKSEKSSNSQGNKLMLATIMQNKRTWKEMSYNNMAQYWEEHVGKADAIHWQDIHTFDLDAWSTILFPLPHPKAYL